MDSFHGFTSTGSPIEIPANFFTELLSEVKDLHALKILLLALKMAGSTEEQISYFIPQKMADEYFPGDQPAFWQGLEIAIKQNWLLSLETAIAGTQTKICLLNTPKNAAARQAIQQGKITLAESGVDAGSERPDIFSVYEQNIGPLTPIIADTLKELEETYPPDWISKAIQTAVKNNAAASDILK